jgi:hypothetical protein
MSNWLHVENFAKRFSLTPNAARPEARALFEPSIEFAASLIDLVAELDVRQELLSGFDRPHARENLMRAAQYEIEAVVLALGGMYTSANVIYRLSVEAILRSMFTDEQVIAELDPNRPEDWDVGPADYRRILIRRASLKGATNRLYTVYRTLSKVAHGDLHLFSGLDQHLHGLPRFVEKEAGALRDIMSEGNHAAGLLIRSRFRSLFAVAHLERVANFDRVVRDQQG